MLFRSFPFLYCGVLYHLRQGFLSQSFASAGFSALWSGYCYHSLFPKKETNFLLSQIFQILLAGRFSLDILHVSSYGHQYIYFAVKKSQGSFFIHEAPEASHRDQKRRPSYARQSHHNAAQYGEFLNDQIPLE